MSGAVTLRGTTDQEGRQPKYAHALDPIHLLADVSIQIGAHQGGWITTFIRRDRAIAEDRCAKPPWIDSGASRRLGAILHREAPELDKNAVKNAIEGVLNEINNSPDSGGIVTEPVARVIDETIGVQIELSKPVKYKVILKGGRSLLFSAKEIAGPRAIVLNEAWLNTHPHNPLRATKGDFEAIIEYWLLNATDVAPLAEDSPYEPVVEDLQAEIAQKTVYATTDGLRRGELYQEGDGPLWVPSNSIITPLLRKSGISDNRFFAQYLEDIGVLIERSSNKGGTRSWGFRPDFRPDEPEGDEFLSLTGDEGGGS